MIYETCLIKYNDRYGPSRTRVNKQGELEQPPLKVTHLKMEKTAAILASNGEDFSTI